MLSQKQTDGQHHLGAYTSQSLTIHEHNYHSTKQEFLALKLAIAKQFSGIPTLETVHCQNQQQSSHLHHDYT